MGTTKPGIDALKIKMMAEDDVHDDRSMSVEQKVDAFE